MDRSWRSSVRLSFVPTLVMSAWLVGCSSAPDDPASNSNAQGAIAERSPVVAPVIVEDDDDTQEGDPAALEGASTAFFPEGTFVDPGAPPPTTPPTPPKGPYAHLDPTHLVPAQLLSRAVSYFDANKAIITNRDYLTVVDFSPHSGKKRFFVIDMKSGVVKPHVVAHGKGSDPTWTGYATTFSNVSGSNMSSVGFAVTGETYFGSHGRSLRLKGLSPTNSNMLTRAIVIHSASYVIEGAAKQGRSLGCFVLDEAIKDDVIDMIEGGSLLYAGTV